MSSVLQHPFNEPPAPGARREVAPGVHWLYFPLPFALDHINLWLIEDGDGWTLVDTGFGSAGTRDVWRTAFDDALEGRPIRRILVTHYHPDHVGQAAWLAETFQAPVWMTGGEWALTRRLHQASDDEVGEGFRQLFGRHGLPDDALETLAGRGNVYRRVLGPLPSSPTLIAGGDRLEIGGDAWRVHIGRGHAPEHACLYRERDRLLISGDQVLPRISSNLTVRAHEPDDDPVTDFVDSLRALRAALPEDTLVLPAHGLPFRGLHQRIDDLCAHHDEQLDAARAACVERPLTAFDLLPVLFKRELDNHQLMFAMGESIAHLNCLHATGRVRREERDGVLYHTA
ncbi:MAG: MBL fold metallo-hydrolase [Alcanivorax sp.]|nr:MBL fold metallo-hydrolase [Alcanivorax sp.]